jgi:hypothetical protein
VKTQATVRQHLKKTKKGKLGVVKLHTRKLKGSPFGEENLSKRERYLNKLGGYKMKSLQRAVEVGKNILREPTNKQKYLKDFGTFEKNQAIQFILKNRPSKSTQKVRLRAERLLSKVGRIHSKVFGRVEKLQGKMKKKGLIGRIHPIEGLKVGNRVRIREAGYPKELNYHSDWKVSEIARNDAGEKYIKLQSRQFKDLTQKYPKFKLQSLHDQGLVRFPEIERASKKARRKLRLFEKAKAKHKGVDKNTL